MKRSIKHRKQVNEIQSKAVNELAYLNQPPKPPPIPRQTQRNEADRQRQFWNLHSRLTIDYDWLTMYCKPRKRRK